MNRTKLSAEKAGTGVPGDRREGEIENKCIRHRLCRGTGRSVAMFRRIDVKNPAEYFVLMAGKPFRERMLT
jgi:hypothetical protein